CATSSASKESSPSGPIASLASRKANRAFPIILRASSRVSLSARASNSSREVMILREFSTSRTDVAFLRKYGGMSHLIRSRCEARLAQEFSKSNSTCDIATYPTINRPKSQNASLFLECLLLFYIMLLISGCQQPKFLEAFVHLSGKLPVFAR